MPLETLLTSWANQWLNISIRIGINMCSSLKLTSLSKPTSRRFVEADLLQRITDFAFGNQTLAASCFSLPKVGEVGYITTELLNQEVRTASKVITEVRPKGVVHLTIQAAHAFVRDLTDSKYRKRNLRTSSSRANALQFTASLRTLFSLDQSTYPLNHLLASRSRSHLAKSTVRESPTQPSGIAYRLRILPP